MSDTGSGKLTRRSAVRAFGAAAVGFPAVGRRTRKETTDGQLVFVYDDSPIQDYRKAFAVHHDEGVPACAAAVVDIVESDSGVDPHHLREMQDDGWEIISHTMTHRAMGRMRLSADLAPGDTRAYVPYNYHGATPGDPLLVTDGEREDVIVVVGRGSDEDGPYLDLERSPEMAFPAGETHVRFTDAVLRHELVEARTCLEGMGLEVDNFVYPFDSKGPRVDELVRRYYDGVGNWNRDGLNPGVDPDPYRIGRGYFRTDMYTEAEVGSFLDEIAAGDHLGMLAGHSYFTTIPAERIRATIRMAKRRDLEIVTLREAFQQRGLDEYHKPPTLPVGVGPRR